MSSRSEIGDVAAGEAAPSDPDTRHDATSQSTVAVPWLPPGRFVQLDERGTVLVRDFGGPAGAPTLLLLHGWTATADLNWFRCYRALGERYRIIAFDHRGHGAGIRTRKAFRLEDCADDAIDVATALGIERVIPVGYSMGGPIAQLVWRRHPDRVDGLVLCATAPYFARRREERLSFLGLTGLAAVARVTPENARAWLTRQLYLQRKTAQWDSWAMQEAGAHDWRMVLEAGRSLGQFSSFAWLGDVDVPVATVMTMRDTIVPVERQLRLFEMIPHAQAFRVDGGHDAVITDADRFVAALLDALESVTARVH